MKRQMTIGEYRSIDLSLFAVMLIVSETVIINAATKWFPGEAYTVSVVAAITAIVMMRWGAWAAVHAVIGGFVFVLVSGGTARQYVIYCIGNLFSLGALGLLRLWGSEPTREDKLKSLAFAFAVQVLMQFGRGAVSQIFGTKLSEAVGFVTTDALSILFTLVIIWISRRLDGVFENQKHYLLRLNKEREEGKGGL